MKTFEITVLRNTLVERRMKYTINAETLEEAKNAINNDDNEWDVTEIEEESSIDLEDYEVKSIIETKEI